MAAAVLLLNLRCPCPTLLFLQNKLFQSKFIAVISPGASRFVQMQARGWLRMCGGCGPCHACLQLMVQPCLLAGFQSGHHACCTFPCHLQWTLLNSGVSLVGYYFAGNCGSSPGTSLAHSIWGCRVLD